MFQKDRIFATMNLSEAEMKLYDGLARIMEQQIAVPDFIVYLQSSTGRLMANIRKRDREIERNMSEKYIHTLNEMYNSFFTHFEQIPVIMINMDNMDFIGSEKDFKKIVNLVTEKSTGS